MMLTTVSSVSPAVVNQCTCRDNGLMVFVTLWLFEVIILVSLLVGAFYIYSRIYRKQRAAERGGGASVDQSEPRGGGEPHHSTRETT
ncbi:hypothetical protein AMEX_G711 [Astyanax mexicanus]|uniref:Uncharacterized protein n=1 Tax=Astyanax mexicanus TaxID=7994 RepID=A0A8T2MN42_ASTMX|nr:hypothetical protein AMEX_G711 [Astyanax mexicanus]